jgi:hypothetical protein
MAYNDDTDESLRPGKTEGQATNEATDPPGTIKEPGFWAKVGQGKPRPAPKEPDITYYRNRRGDAG